jgi:hypothetical protein
MFPAVLVTQSKERPYHPGLVFRYRCLNTKYLLPKLNLEYGLAVSRLHCLQSITTTIPRRVCSGMKRYYRARDLKLRGDVEYKAGPLSSLLQPIADQQHPLPTLTPTPHHYQRSLYPQKQKCTPESLPSSFRSSPRRVQYLNLSPQTLLLQSKSPSLTPRTPVTDVLKAPCPPVPRPTRL